MEHCYTLKSVGLSDVWRTLCSLAIMMALPGKLTILQPEDDVTRPRKQFELPGRLCHGTSPLLSFLNLHCGSPWLLSFPATATHWYVTRH